MASRGWVADPGQAERIYQEIDKREQSFMACLLCTGTLHGQSVTVLKPFKGKYLYLCFLG